MHNKYNKKKDNRLRTSLECPKDYFVQRVTNGRHTSFLLFNKPSFSFLAYLRRRARERSYPSGLIPLLVEFVFLWLLVVLFLCVLLVLFSPLVLYLFSCLLINTRRCIHFDFCMIISYLVSVPLFKSYRGLVHNCTDILVSRWVFLYFRLFCIESFDFRS